MTLLADFPLPNHLLSQRSADGAQIKVSLHGGHLCSWTGADGSERLFMSTRTKWDGEHALRGGVPVIFPQFADFGPLPKHGFARMLPWQLLESSCTQDGAGVLRLGLTDSAATAALAGKFALEISFHFSDTRMNIALVVHNTGTTTFAFTAALHTYLRVAVAECTVRGLTLLPYRDSTDGGRVVQDLADGLAIDREIDRIYSGVTGSLMLDAPARRVTLTQNGFEDVVVWNPWRDKARVLDDLAPHEYQHFVCLESALIAHPQTLLPAQSWSGEQRIYVADLPPHGN